MLAVSSMLPISSNAATVPATTNPPPAVLAGGGAAIKGSDALKYVVVQPVTSITFSSETTASVDKVNVKEGESFRAGTILLTLDCRIQKADLDKAIARQTLAHAAAVSAQKLRNYGSISNFEYTQATTNAASANADVSKLNAIVDKCTIKAPFNGAVSNVPVHPYESIKPGDPLLKIVSSEDLYFETQVPSEWLAWLHVGSLFQVKLNETSKIVAVKVTRINPQIDSVTQTVKIVGRTAQPDVTLEPGMSGQASFGGNALATLAKPAKPSSVVANSAIASPNLPPNLEREGSTQN